MSSIPHFPDIRLTDGSEVSLTCGLRVTSQEDSWYSFLLEAEPTPGPYCGSVMVKELGYKPEGRWFRYR
jgi:hypothetical protein